MRALALACVLLVLPLSVGAQSAPPAAQPPRVPPPTDPPPAGQPTFRTGVGVVRVDVTVTGKDDCAIIGLTAEDFEVREDGAAQQVQSLQLVQVIPSDIDAAPIRDAEHAAREASRDDVRLLVIFLDDYHLRFGPLFDTRLKQMLRGFIEAEMRPSDLFAVMGPLTPMTDLGLTRDKQAILDCLNTFQGRLGGFVPPRSALEETQVVLGGRQLPRIRAEVTLSALQSLVTYLGALRDGRASVLFVSEGPPIGFDGSTQLTATLRNVVTAANTSNVTIHTLDPRELGAARYASGVNDGLSAETGGRRLAQSNDFSKGLRAVLSDAGAYYLLGYEPARDPADGRFHKIEVKVRRKDVRVLARKGYWAPKPAELTAAREATPAAPPAITQALAAVSRQARPRSCLDWIGLGPLESGQTTVTVACAPSAVTAAGATTRARESAGFEVRVLDTDGRVVAAHAAARGTGDCWQARFTAAPGPLSLRMVATDNDGGEIDGWTRALTVPAVTDVAARFGTPLVFRAMNPAAFRAFDDRDDETAATIERQFRRTDRVVVRWPTLPAVTAAALKAELVNGRGQTLLTLPVTRRSPASRPEVELPLANLAQAAYVLRLTAGLDGAQHSTLIGFAVVP